MESITTLLNPKNEDGSVDTRYSETTKELISRLGAKGIEALTEIKDGQLYLMQTHGWVFRKLVDYFYELAQELRENRDSKYAWKSQRLLSQIPERLAELGATSQQVTKLMKAKEFRESLRKRSHAKNRVLVTFANQLEFVESYGVSSQYVLSLMSEEGLKNAMKVGKKKGEILPFRELEEIKKQYPKSGRRPKSKTFDPVANKSLITSTYIDTDGVAVRTTSQGKPETIPTKSVDIEVLEDPSNSQELDERVPLYTSQDLWEKDFIRLISDKDVLKSAFTNEAFLQRLEELDFYELVNSVFVPDSRLINVEPLPPPCIANESTKSDSQ